MSDPQRLLSSSSEADDLELELLGSIQSVDPPVGAKAEVWGKLATGIATVGLLSGAAESTTSGAAAPAQQSIGWATPALKALGSKLAVGIAVAGGAIGGSIWFHTHTARSGPVVPAKSAVAVSALQAQVVPAATERSAPAEAAPSSPGAPEIPAKSGADRTHKGGLSEESALLTKARAELRRGDAATAQQTLDQLRVRFKNGMLGQEREVLAIEVLAARGYKAVARDRARAFIAAYPKSPHSAQLTRFAESP